MGMAGQAGGANMQNLYQMGAQQQAAQQQAAQNMQPASGAGTWKCECGAEKYRKFMLLNVVNRNRSGKSGYAAAAQ